MQTILIDHWRVGTVCRIDCPPPGWWVGHGFILLFFAVGVFAGFGVSLLSFDDSVWWCFEVCFVCLLACMPLVDRWLCALCCWCCCTRGGRICYAMLLLLFDGTWSLATRFQSSPVVHTSICFASGGSKFSGDGLIRCPPKSESGTTSCQEQ